MCFLKRYENGHTESRLLLSWQLKLPHFLQFHGSTRQMLGHAYSQTMFGSLKVGRLSGRKLKARREARDVTIDHYLATSV